MEITEFEKRSQEYAKRMVEICDGFKNGPLLESIKADNLDSHMFTDVHGDMRFLLYNLLASGVARFKDSERSTVYYDIETGETYETMEEFSKAEKNTESRKQFTSDEEYLAYRLVVIPNIEPNPSFRGGITLMGDLIDRGDQNEACLYTVLNFKQQIKEGQRKKENKLWKGRDKFRYVAGNHEDMFYKGADKYFNTEFSRKPSTKKKTFVEKLQFWKTDEVTKGFSRIASFRKGAARNRIGQAIRDGDIVFAHVTKDGMVQSHTWWSKKDMLSLQDSLKSNEEIIKKVVGEDMFKTASALVEKLASKGPNDKNYSVKELQALVTTMNLMYKSGVLVTEEEAAQTDDFGLGIVFGDQDSYGGSRGLSGLLWNDSSKHILEMADERGDLLPIFQIIGHTPERDDMGFTCLPTQYGSHVMCIDLAASSGYEKGGSIKGVQESGGSYVTRVVFSQSDGFQLFRAKFKGGFLVGEEEAPTKEGSFFRYSYTKLSHAIPILKQQTKDSNVADKVTLDEKDQEREEHFRNQRTEEFWQNLMAKQDEKAKKDSGEKAK